MIVNFLDCFIPAGCCHQLGTGTASAVPD